MNDFRKIAGIEAYAPTDNVSELTARTDDDGWKSVFEGWLKVSRLSSKDVIFVFSVGGGDLERNVSPKSCPCPPICKKCWCKNCWSCWAGWRIHIEGSRCVRGHSDD